MRAIEALTDWPPLRRLRHLTARQTAVAFGAALMLSVVLTLAAGEGLARLHDARPATPDAIDWSAVMGALARPEPGAAELFPAGTTLYGLGINSLGLRGPDVPLDKPDGTLRLVFLGDSKLMNVEMAEHDMVAARTAQLLSERLPDCRFDHLTGAGPAYTIDDLAWLVDDRVRDHDADLYVLLTGSVRDMLNRHDDLDPGRGYIADYPFLAHYSRLWDKLARAFHLSRQSRIAEQRGVLPDSELDAITGTLVEPAARLAAAIGDVPVLALGYRGQVRVGQPDHLLRRYTRQIRIETVGLGGADFAALGERMIERMQDIAATHGWTYADPIADIAPTDDNFADSAHFSAHGIGLFAERLADAIAPMLDRQGVACAR